MKFKNMSANMEIETTKGLLIIDKTEYYQIEDARKNSPIVINKPGIQKIEDFFGVSYIQPTINQVWNSNNNFNLVVTVGLKYEDEIIYGVGSANNLSLATVISQAYPAEMAIKRAKGVAALELLRKNYSGSDRLPLLYTAHDEFDAEQAINATVEIVDATPQAKTKTVEEPKVEAPKVEVQKTTETPKVETTPEPAVTEPAKEEVTSVTEETTPALEENTPAESSATTESSVDQESVENFVLTTSKYRNGITVAELHEKDISYYKWLATSTVSGKYVLFQEKVKAHMEKFNIQVA